MKTYSERLARLRDREYCQTPEFWDQVRASGLGLGGEELAFVTQFQLCALDTGIPVVCRYASDAGVELVHAQWRDRLDALDWVVFGQLGEEVVQKFGFDAKWHAAEKRPWLWSVNPTLAITEVDKPKFRDAINAEIDEYLAILRKAETPDYNG